MNTRALVFSLGVVFWAACSSGKAPVTYSEPAVRSRLFPADWTPAMTGPDGRFLHDFSYAGFRNSEELLPDLTDSPVFDVVNGYGADPAGATDATTAIQNAIDDAETAGGGIVLVPEGLYRVEGMLTVETSGVVLRGEGAESSRIFFTSSEGMTGKSHLTLAGAVSYGTEYLLAGDGEARSDTVLAGDALGLAVGDDVVVGFVITDEFIAEHSMTGTWQAFNGTWQPVFRRQVLAVDTSVVPHLVRFDVPLRYPVKTRDQASLRVVTGYLSEVGVESLGLANAVSWAAAWEEERVHVLELSAVKDAWVRNVSSFLSPMAPVFGAGVGAHLQNGGILVEDSLRVTIAGCRMEKAQHRGGGGCGYLFEIMKSSEILTRDCQGRQGRHNFIQNWGFGTSGCVWLRCSTSGGLALFSVFLPGVGQVGHSEYHHSLATANLVDSCIVDDGWSALNRQFWSTGAGHSATQCVFWNTSGFGELRSAQFGQGYVIGTGEYLAVNVTLTAPDVAGTEPGDWMEAIGRADNLIPSSLYEAQFELRTGTRPE